MIIKRNRLEIIDDNEEIDVPTCENCGTIHSESELSMFIHLDKVGHIAVSKLCDDCWVIKYADDDQGTDFLS